MIKAIVDFLWGKSSGTNDSSESSKRSREEPEKHQQQSPRKAARTETSSRPSGMSSSNRSSSPAAKDDGRGTLTTILYNSTVASAWDQPLVKGTRPRPQSTKRASSQPPAQGVNSSDNRYHKAQELQKQKPRPATPNLDPTYDEEGVLSCAQLCNRLDSMHVRPFLDYRDQQEARFELEDAVALREYQNIVRGVVEQHVAQATTSQLGRAWNAFSEAIRVFVVDTVRTKAPPSIGVIRLIRLRQPSVVPVTLDTSDKKAIASLKLAENMSSSSGGATEVVLPAAGFQIQRYQLSSVVGRGWLNDQVINYYFTLVDKQYPGVCCLGSHFYAKLDKQDFDGARRWTKRIDVFDKEIVFVVVNSGVHWTLCVVFVNESRIVYYDSLGGEGRNVLSNVQTFFQQEYEKKMPGVAGALKVLPPRRWDLLSPKTAFVPQQSNGYDCGVFACQIGLCIAEGKSSRCALRFSQKDIPFLRELMILELLEGSLLRRL